MNPYPETLPTKETAWDRVCLIAALLGVGGFCAAISFFIIWVLWVA